MLSVDVAALLVLFVVSSVVPLASTILSYGFGCIWSPIRLCELSRWYLRGEERPLRRNRKSGRCCCERKHDQGTDVDSANCLCDVLSVHLRRRCADVRTSPRSVADHALGVHHPSKHTTV